MPSRSGCPQKANPLQSGWSHDVALAAHTPAYSPPPPPPLLTRLLPSPRSFEECYAADSAFQGPTTGLSSALYPLIGLNITVAAVPKPGEEVLPGSTVSSCPPPVPQGCPVSGRQLSCCSAACIGTADIDMGCVSAVPGQFGASVVACHSYVALVHVLVPPPHSVYLGCPSPPTPLSRYLCSNAPCFLLPDGCGCYPLGDAVSRRGPHQRCGGASGAAGAAAWLPPASVHRQCAHHPGGGWRHGEGLFGGGEREGEEGRGEGGRMPQGWGEGCGKGGDDI